MKAVLTFSLILASTVAYSQWDGPDDNSKIYYSKGYVGIGGYPVHRFHLKSYDERPLLFAETPETSLSFGQHFLEFRAKHNFSYTPYIAWFTPSGKRQAILGRETSTFGLRLENGFSFSILGGDVGIGVDNTKGFKLAVGGRAVAEEIVVKLKANWPDYVFDSAYVLPPLHEVHNHIAKHGRLPDVPSAEDVKKDGVEVGQMTAVLLRKIEELTLYLLEAQKREASLIERMRSLEVKVLNANQNSH